MKTSLNIIYSIFLFSLFSFFSVKANPTVGTVTSGAATIRAAPGTTTITQTSNAAIINWQTFSINHGETTQFLQPSSQSAVLNRVLGGGTSQIAGTLLANGQLFLINQNGIVVGPGGMVSAAGGFTASSRDILDTSFLRGKLHFIGHGRAGVKNAGQVTSSLGNVILIGKTADNKATIKASGTVGLVAGDNILLGQQNSDGSTITVNPSPVAKAASAKTGVANSGSISGATAELTAANGNIYSLAINNTGIVRATTVTRQGGKILLSSDSGSIINSGGVVANGLANGSKGGSVMVKTGSGRSDTVTQSGAIDAMGGPGGSGGTVDVSGGHLSLFGTVNTTSPDGETGSFEIDPTTLQVIAGGSHSITATKVDNTYLDGLLNTTSVTLNADTKITISSPVKWTSDAALTLMTSTAGSTININAAITATAGQLDIDAAAATDKVTVSATSAIDLNSFVDKSGDWSQLGNGKNLAAFTVTEFDLANTQSTFFRAAGGAGTVASPYQISDVFGLLDLTAKPSADYVLTANLDASEIYTKYVTATQNWFPTEFAGSLNGANYTLSNPTAVGQGSTSIGYVGGLFAQLDAGASISNLNVTGVLIDLPVGSDVGGLVGLNQGTITNCSSNVSSEGSYFGGLVGYNEGEITGCKAQIISGIQSWAGLVYANAGSITNCSAVITGGGGGGPGIGGLVAFNGGTISGSSATGTISTPDAVQFGGGLVGENANSGTITNSTSDVSMTITGTADYVGGFVGYNVGGSITGSISKDPVFSFSGASSRADVGGFVGYNSASISGCTSSTPNLTYTDTDDHYYIGGFVGYNISSISGCTSTTDLPFISIEQLTPVTGTFGGYNSGTISSSTGVTEFPYPQIGENN